MTVVKSKAIVFCVPVCFLKKKKKKKQTTKNNNNNQELFFKYINIKTEMNLCSGKTAKLKDLFPIERDCGLNGQLYIPYF